MLTLGPSPLLWLLFVPPHQATLGNWPYGWAVSMTGPPWRSGVAAAGSQAIGSWKQLLSQGKALGVEAYASRGAGAPNRITMPSM